MTGAGPRHLFRSFFSILLPAMASVACGGEPGEEKPAETTLEEEEAQAVFSMRVSGVGLRTPESVLHDPEADVYLVSNISGDPAAKDDDGFISRIGPRGNVEELRWIDGAAGNVTLHAPKGMALVGDTLFVADIDCVRRFHRVTGEPGLGICLDDAGFLNDLAAGPAGDLFISDSGTREEPGGIYRLRNRADVPHKVVLADGTVLEGEGLGGPNGLVADERGLFVVTSGSGEVFRVTPEGERVPLLPPSDMQLDGLVSLEEWGFLFSSWEDGAVYWTTPDGNITVLVDGLEAPADLGYDAGRNRVLIPLFRGNELLIREVR